MVLKNSDAAVVTNTVTNPVPNQPLTEAEAAARLGLKVATLRAWRHQGRGPAYVRLGRAVRYLTTDIDEFLNSNRHGPRMDRESVPHLANENGTVHASRSFETQTVTRG